MPRRRNGELPLPHGWEEGRDFDGKTFYLNHNTHQTTWIDPRDRYTKPQSFSDCVGDELPYGWEELFCPQVGVYYVDHGNQTNQLEDPRRQWKVEQEHMLKDYLVTARDDLEAKQEIYSVKQQRLMLAQDEYKYLNETLTGWKSSRTSLNSNSSVGSSTRYDPDLLKADVSLAKQRVARLKRELEQVKVEMQYKQQGLHKLTMVDQKLSGQGYNIDEARQIVEEIQTIQKSLATGEHERQQLMQSLARLKEDFFTTKIGGSSPDISTLCIPQESATTASQTDLRGEYSLGSSRYLAEITKLRLQYDDSKKRLSELKYMLTDLEDNMMPGQNESDKDRLLLVQEKEQLLRELRSIECKGRSDDDVERVNQEIQRLRMDLNHAKEVSNKQIADRLQHQEKKTEILHELAETTKMTTQLETQLRSLSMSTLSMSSGSSLGSLGSLSASSRGSLNSLGMIDIYGQSTTNDTDLHTLHQRVEKLLQGHTNISPIDENSMSLSPDVMAAVSPDVMAAATSGYLQSVLAGSNPDMTGVGAMAPTGVGLAPPGVGMVPSGVGGILPPGVGSLAPPGVGSLAPPGGCSVGVATGMMPPPSSSPSLQPAASVSPHSSLSSISPPVSPYDMGPPPAYKPHIAPSSLAGTTNMKPPSGPLRRAATSNIVNTSIHPPHIPPVSSNQSKLNDSTNLVTNQSKSESTRTMYGVLSSDVGDGVHNPGNVARRPQYLDNCDSMSNPPLSPISESSSGVGNNLSGGNTRSMSAAVSDESVAGDSGVFEAVVKRDNMLDEALDMGLESAQIQIKLKYDGIESTLVVGVEQARNLSALQFPDDSQVCVKAALLPNPAESWETRPSVDTKNPKFCESFRIVIPQRMLFTKTLQVNIWCLHQNRLDECFGCASVSLADFDPKDISVRWYNVLSFKFMQSDTAVPSKKSSSSSESSVRENVTTSAGGLQPDSPHPVPHPRSDDDKVVKLLEASSARLRKVSHTSNDSNKDSSHFRVHRHVTSLKEESSDESTAISSQTSTLTRNQGPGDMEEHGDAGGDTCRDDTLKFDVGPSEDEDLENDLDYSDLHMVDVIRGFDKTIDGICSSEGSTDQDDLLYAADSSQVCDKETNTAGAQYLPDSAVRTSFQRPDIENMRSNAVRRSQTFSLACRQGPNYVCKLNRSDSDSSMPLYKRGGSFQRNSLERRSLRFKRAVPPGPVPSSKLRTSLDIELDLQASHTKLSHLKDENRRLRELKQRMEEAKARGETELPVWMSDDEQFQNLLTEADKMTWLMFKHYFGRHKDEPVSPMSKQDRRAEQLMKRITRDVHRNKRSQPNALSASFREKLAYIAAVNMKVPVIPTDAAPSDDRTSSSSSDSAPLRGDYGPVLPGDRASSLLGERTLPKSLGNISETENLISIPVLHEQSSQLDGHKTTRSIDNSLQTNERTLPIFTYDTPKSDIKVPVLTSNSSLSDTKTSLATCKLSETFRSGKLSETVVTSKSSETIRTSKSSETVITGKKSETYRTDKSTSEIITKVPVVSTDSLRTDAKVLVVLNDKPKPDDITVNKLLTDERVGHEV